MKMVTVIGAGPIGTYLARRTQEMGWQSTILEEHSNIGKPVNCTGLISSSGVESSNIQKEVEETLINKIRGAQIFSPNHEMIEVKKSSTVAYVINRGNFDAVLAREAEDAGVEIKKNTKMIDIRNETVFVEHKGRGEIHKSKLVVGTDGVNSKTRKIMGFETNIKNYVHAYQAVVKGNFNPKYVQIYFGDYSKGFFAWVVPENEEKARIGVASNFGNIKKNFDLFVKEKNLGGHFSEKCSSLIPIGAPLKNIVQENIMLAGDSAFQTKATTGGGIILGIESAEKAAQTINDYFKNNKPLTNYEKNLKETNKELKLHWKIRQFLNSKNEEQMDKFFQKLNKANIGEFLSANGDMDKPSHFVGKILTKPSLWKMFPEALKFMRT